MLLYYICRVNYPVTASNYIFRYFYRFYVCVYIHV
ncbi:hypothetical protein Zm00014a_002699 [Zea mays]|uniref:Uncharacterized protein n=1 Tax=Zea mays TaxID=4577 RepID=A0A317Y5S5_MAIZE|nr:hypothetical protein Zm00014a_002699 [Zea mays]